MCLQVGILGVGLALPYVWTSDVCLVAMEGILSKAALSVQDVILTAQRCLLRVFHGHNVRAMQDTIFRAHRALHALET
jgi:hypothetical protein